MRKEKERDNAKVMFLDYPDWDSFFADVIYLERKNKDKELEDKE